MTKIKSYPPPAEEVLLKMADLCAYLTKTNIIIDIEGPGNDRLHAEFNRREDFGGSDEE